MVSKRPTPAVALPLTGDRATPQACKLAPKFVHR